MPNEPEKPELPSEDEIEARFNKIRENLHPDLDDVDLKLAGILDNTKVEPIPESEHDEYRSKLAELDEKMKQAKQNRDKGKPSTMSGSISGSLDQKSSVSMGLGFMLAYTIVGTPLLGFGVGILINKVTHTDGWQIWLTLLGSVIGLSWVIMVTNRHGKDM